MLTAGVPAPLVDRPVPPCTGIAVVVPAHDEQALLPACLASLAAASADVPVRVLVVADACSDATARVAADAGVEVLEVDRRSAGASRRAGLDALVASWPAPLDGLWLATTDADSRVPASWLTDQLALRAQGWHAVAGLVAVDDWGAHGPAVQQRFAARYAWTGADHPHVHGANLGLTAASYRAVGGFPALALAEDHALVAALEAHGLRVARSAAPPVLTSARADPRCAGGFGELLVSLGGAG